MLPTFDESVLRYEGFLAKHGFPSKVIWVTPEDILVSTKPVVYVRVPVSKENERFAKQLFDFGISQEKGVLFETLCESKDLTFAYVWVPRDERESEEYLMPNGLKLSARQGSSRRPARLVGNRLHWTYLQLRYSELQKFREQLFP